MSASQPAAGNPLPSLPQIDTETTAGRCAASIAGGSAALNSDGEAGVGYLLARSEANLFDAPRPEDASTYAQVGFRDSIVVTSPGRSGVVTVRGQIFFDGLLDVTGVGEAGMRLRMIATSGSVGQVFLEECPLYSLCFGAYGNYPRIFSEARDVHVTLTLGSTKRTGSRRNRSRPSPRSARNAARRRPPSLSRAWSAAPSRRPGSRRCRR